MSSSLKQVRFVIFDWAGTLSIPLPPMDPIRPWLSYTHAVSEIHAPDEAAQRLLEAELACHRNAQVNFRSQNIFEVISAAGVPIRRAGMLAYLKQWWPYTRIATDALETLTYLRRLPLGVGMLSNTIWPRSWHQSMLLEQGLWDLLNAAVFSTDIGFVKPHPEAFKAISNALGAWVPAEVLFIGDRGYEDIFGARRYGFQTGLISRAKIATDFVVETTVQPDYEISSLLDLRTLINPRVS